jgi:hypothetical protein
MKEHGGDAANNQDNATSPSSKGSGWIIAQSYRLVKYGLSTTRERTSQWGR